MTGERQPDLNLGALAPVSDEVVISDLRVEGEIPEDLNGMLARNGPNPFEGHFTGEGMLSWWGGAAMLHGVAFEDGRALWYRNQWVKTGNWDRYTDPSKAPDPDRDHNTNVNVISHSGRILALGEGGMPFAVTPELDTLGPVDFGGSLPGGMTAHPKIDPDTGELIYFRADWQKPYLHYGVLDAVGRVQTAQEIDLDSPVMMHDFAVTARHSIFLDLGVVYDFQMMQHGAPMPIRWHEGRQSRLGVIPRSGGEVRWFEIAPCFIQHVVNACELEPDELRLEAVRYSEFLRWSPQEGFAANPLGTLWRYDIDLISGEVAESQIDDHHIELPRIDDRLAGRRNDVLYAVEQPSDSEMRGVVKLDTRRQTLERFEVKPGDQNSEPVFVPRPQGSAEDDGWILTCVYRRATHTSDVVILDAADISGTPQAVVHLPRRIPAGFHGAWLPTAL